MSVLRNTWEGELCHKNKIIAKVSALAGQDLPISVPDRLDVHQKVKFEEFKDKVVDKTSGKLTFDTYVTHDEHLLLVTLLVAKTGLDVLESFTNFLYKSQSVGVSVVGDNDSVIFLVPAKLDPGGMFPIFPHTDQVEDPFMYGVVKISKTLVPTLGMYMVKTEDSVANVKQEKLQESQSKTPPPASTNYVDGILTPSPPKPPPRDLTRLSVYMSNLPALKRHTSDTGKTGVTSNQQLPKQKKKLSLSEYRQRLDETTELTDVSNVSTVESDRNLGIQISDSTTVDNLEQGVSDHEKQSTVNNQSHVTIDSRVTRTENEPEKSAKVTSHSDINIDNNVEATVPNHNAVNVNQQIGGLNDLGVNNSERTDATSNVFIPTGVVDTSSSLSEVSHIATVTDKDEPSMIDNLTIGIINNTKTTVSNDLISQAKRLPDNIQYEDTFTKQNFHNASRDGNVTVRSNVIDDRLQQKNSPSKLEILPAKVIAPHLQHEPALKTHAKDIKVGAFHHNGLPEQQFQFPAGGMLTSQHETILKPVVAPNMKRERDDSEYARYTVIQPVHEHMVFDVDHESPVSFETDPVKSESSLFGDDLDQDLPDLAEIHELPKDGDSNTSPGETVNFNKTESVIFTPDIYTKILDHLDTLKLLLGETAKQNSTTHREKCMLMVDKIGDRLIGNRLRKTCVTRSYGCVTDVAHKRVQNPSKEVQTDLDGINPEDDHPEKVSEKSLETENTTSEILENGNHKKKVQARNKKEKQQPDNGEKRREKERPSQRNKRVTIEDHSNKSVKPSKRRKRDVSSDNTDEEAEGYFTMLLKLNGALEEEKRRSKTVTRVHKTSVRRITKSNVENSQSEATAATTAPLQDTDERYCATPEVGATPHDSSSVKLVDGRLLYTKKDRYASGNNRSSIEEPQHTVASTSQPTSSTWPAPQATQAVPWHGTEPVQPQTGHNLAITEHPYSQNTPTAEPTAQNGVTPTDDHPLYNAQPPQGRSLQYPGFPADPEVKQHTQTERPGMNTQPQFGTNTVESHLTTQQYGYIEYPNHSLESDIQKSLHDVDLRLTNFQGPPGIHPPTNPNFPPVPFNPNVPPPTPNNSIITYENMVSTTIPPHVENTSTVNTTTETSAVYTTDSTVTVFNQQQQVIDQDMESEMIDILEILHEGSAPEPVTLQKPKGRSKRARKKRRAIAEAEKLYSLVVKAQKIEKQQKLNVLSEKQKKREFYKRIIHTYAGKGDEQQKPKDEESMIMECVEQIMENHSDTEGSTKTESTDVANKKKTDEDFTLDDYNGLQSNEIVATKRNDDTECQIVEHIRHERYLSDQTGRSNKPNGFPPADISLPDSSMRFRRSTSTDKSARSSSSERIRWRESTSPKKGRFGRDKRAIGDDADNQPAVVNMSPEQKSQMFQGWSNSRYSSHLFKTASKITFGSDCTRSWMSKVLVSAKNITSRKKAIKHKLEEGKRARKLSNRNISFRQRDRLEQERVENIRDLEDLDTLDALFNFFSCKYLILEALHSATNEKKTKPSNEKLILLTLCQKLERYLENLREARELLEMQKKLDHSILDQRLLNKAHTECVDMIANIRKETRKHKEQKK